MSSFCRDGKFEVEREIAAAASTLYSLTIGNVNALLSTTRASIAPELFRESLEDKEIRMCASSQCQEPQNGASPDLTCYTVRVLCVVNSHVVCFVGVCALSNPGNSNGDGVRTREGTGIR